MRPFFAMNLSRQIEPLYRELASVLRDELQQFCPGDLLPSEVQLAARFSVNRHTLRRAVDELVLEGLVLRRQGKGTQVLARPLVYPLQANNAFSDSLSALGLRVEAVLLERKKRKATGDESQRLQLPEGAMLIELTTLRLLDEQPVSLIRHRFCASHAPTLERYSGGSLREYLLEQSLGLNRTYSLIGARLPSREEAAQLLMPLHAPLLSVLTLSCDTAGQPVELALSTSRADRFQYQVAP